MRIGVVGLSHETNTFAAEQNDSVDCASIQVGEGVLALGTWQGLYLLEHRIAGHERQVLVHVQGEE